MTCYKILTSPFKPNTLTMMMTDLPVRPGMKVAMTTCWYRHCTVVLELPPRLARIHLLIARIYFEIETFTACSRTSALHWSFSRMHAEVATTWGGEKPPAWHNKFHSSMGTLHLHGSTLWAAHHYSSHGRQSKHSRMQVEIDYLWQNKFTSEMGRLMQFYECYLNKSPWQYHSC